MKAAYVGPLRNEPLALELHNTVYAAGGQVLDGLETVAGLRAWLAAIGDRLPDCGRAADVLRHADFLALRTAVRDALHAAVEGSRVPRSALDEINAVTALAPLSSRVVLRSGGRLRRETRYHTSDATDIALATFAADAIGLLTGPGRDELRACGAPGCVLMFLQDHRRRMWCSAACGNRARQARHYDRTRRA